MPGPVFTNILLVDEINRATPRTQSALLEAMQERQVSVEGTTHLLAEPFVVLATQNPVEFEGTFSLPQAQLDRFLLRVRIGYPAEEAERRIARRYRTAAEPLDAIRPVARRRRDPGAARRGPGGQRSATRSRPTPSRSSGRPGRTPTCSWAQARAPRSRCTGRPRPRRSSTVASFALPDDVRDIAPAS